MFLFRSHEDGLGLGYKLWMARRIMRLHRGELTIIKDQVRTTIILTFPLSSPTGRRLHNQIAEPSEKSFRIFRLFGVPKQVTPVIEEAASLQVLNQEQRPISSSNQCIGESSDGTVWKILVVDDSALVRKMTLKLMRSLGHICEEADDGDVAVEKIRKDPDFDIILMDNQMPRMKGEDATRIIRRDLKYEGIILGVTGNVLPEEIEAFVKKGADAVVSKPLSGCAFVRKIAEVKEQKAAKKRVVVRELSKLSTWLRAPKRVDSQL